MPVLNFGAVKEAILPEWTKPENASVFDPAYRAPVRTLVKWLGLDDPQQAMALGTPLETGAMGGGALEAIAKRFPRFAEALKLNYTTPGQAPFYSRLEEAVGGLPRQVPGPKLLGVVQKGQASAEELAARGVPEFAAQYGTKPIPKEAIAEHLKANPVQLQVKTLGGKVPTVSPDLETLARGHLGRMPNRPEDWERVSRMLEGEAQQFQRRFNDESAQRYFGLSDEATRMSEGLSESGSTAGMPKFSQYQLPGGTNYRETLIQWPGPDKSAYEVWKQSPASADAPAKTEAFFNSLPHNFRQPYEVEAVRRTDRFKSAHWDERNILVHTRSNERELPGLGKGTFLEEVQSDWHQKGKAQGYGKEGVPDAPFKETWPDLALKHHLVEAAQNPETQWLGFTSGETQAARYDLSKHIDSLKFRKFDDGTTSLIATSPGGKVVMNETVQNDKVGDYVGKEMAQKIADHEESGSTLSGLDLKVGGEGMKYFYDTLLPKRLEKIVKPFGGTVERIPSMQVEEEFQRIGGTPGSYRRKTGPEDAAWILRLTPELKKRILTEGLPLMTGVAGVGLASESRNR